LEDSVGVSHAYERTFFIISEITIFIIGYHICKSFILNTQKILYFVKSKITVCFDGATNDYPENCPSMWTEVELGIIVKEDCFKVNEVEASNYIEGFIVCADITCEIIFIRVHYLGYSKSRINILPHVHQHY
jgi:hypothetical protein